MHSTVNNFRNQSVAKSNLLYKSVFETYRKGKRLVAPLVGFPGVKLVRSSIKLAQQNSYEQFKVVKANYEQFLPDAIFPLMDLSVEVNALGKEFIFPENDSASIIKSKFGAGDLQNLKNVNIEYDSRLLSYVETVRLMTKKLPGEVIKGAYVTGPYTIAGLLLGADQAAMSTIINQELLHKICDLAKNVIVKYINLLSEAGAQIICILEPSAVMLSPDQFEIFSANYVKDIISKAKINGEYIYHVCGNTNHLISKIISSGVAALSLDSKEVGVDLCEIAKSVSEEIILIGNINPVGKILNGNAKQVEEEVSSLLEQMKDIPNFILSTGCDLPLDTPIENVETFMDVGKKFRNSNSTLFIS
ncbi:MAG: uroporphyrinogen decarboxylase family protein [Ignavibacteriae bacterium]|nr:uroporphyrinogen decarboxylase family protein [Ignavibacteriota bacterium]